MISRYLTPIFTVTAITAAGSVLPISPASAVTMSIQGLYTTGVNNSGQALTGVSPDPHYTLISQPSGGRVTNPPSTLPPNSPLINNGGPWVPDNATSRWIGDDSSPAGEYIYQTSFILPDDVILSTVVLSGQWTSDNAAEIFLNGQPTGNTNPYDNFGSFSAFNISSGFLTGTNTLSFVVDNFLIPNQPTGLRVGAISGTYEAVPEPFTILGSITALGFGAKMERKFGRKQMKKAHSEA